MKINEVEEKVGITKKNIRFYEEQGLIHPTRDVQNGYRNYSEEDVRELLRIKLFRKLSIPIEEIRKLQDRRLTLSDCLERHLIYLNHEERNLALIKSMCEEIRRQNENLASLDAPSYLEKMRQLEEGGMHFMDVGRTDTRKKKTAPWIAAIVMVLLMAAVVWLLVWAEMEDPLPMGLFLVILLIPVAVAVGTLAALRQRLKEIEGGEENEASKY